MTTETPETPAHLLPSVLFDEWKRCQFCGGKLRKGRTNKGRPSWFDDEPPHANHWATCPNKEQAREFFNQRRRR